MNIATSPQIKTRCCISLDLSNADPYGNLISDASQINDIFKSFYSSLYKSKFPSDISVILEFMDEIEIPKVDPSSVQDLEIMKYLMNFTGNFMTASPNPSVCV